MLLKQPYIGPKIIIFEVILVISVVISVIPVISVNRRTVLAVCFQLTGSAVITHDVTTGTGYCLVGFNWIIIFFN